MCSNHVVPHLGGTATITSVGRGVNEKDVTGGSLLRFSSCTCCSGVHTVARTRSSGEVAEAVSLLIVNLYFCCMLILLGLGLAGQSKVRYWQLIDIPRPISSYCFYKDICPSPNLYFITWLHEL